MSNVDPWEKAADCARTAQKIGDPERRAIFTNLQQLWVALGNESGLMTAQEIANEAERIGRLQAELAAADARLLRRPRGRILRSRGAISAVPRTSRFPRLAG
jgi:hypothetical protein